MKKWWKSLDPTVRGEILFLSLMGGMLAYFGFLLFTIGIARG